MGDLPSQAKKRQDCGAICGTPPRRIVSRTKLQAVFTWVLPVFVRLQPGKEEIFSPACVLVFIFKDTEPSALQDSFSVRQQGGLPGPHQCLSEVEVG